MTLANSLAADETPDGCPVFRGMSSHAILHPEYPTDALTEILRGSDAPALTVLVGTFGEQWSNFGRVIRDIGDKPHVVVVYLLNEAGRRGERLKSGELFPDADVATWNFKLEVMGKSVEAQLWERMQTTKQRLRDYSNENTHVVIIPGLEDQYTNLAWHNLFMLTAQHMGEYTIARNPLKAKDPFPAQILEMHNLDALWPTNLCIGNLDGTSVDLGASFYQPSISPLKATEYLKGIDCQLRLLWHARSQGLDTGWSAPKSRDFLFTDDEVIGFKNMLMEASR